MSGRSTTSIFGCTKPRIDIVPIDSELVDTATQAWLAFGKGRNPAASNFADCLSYALARRAGLPLFYKRMTSHKPMSKRSVDRLQISQVRALHTRSTISRQTVKPSCQAAGCFCGGALTQCVFSTRDEEQVKAPQFAFGDGFADRSPKRRRVLQSKATQASYEAEGRGRSPDQAQNRRS